MGAREHKLDLLPQQGWPDLNQSCERTHTDREAEILDEQEIGHVRKYFLLGTHNESVADASKKKWSRGQPH